MLQYDVILYGRFLTIKLNPASLIWDLGYKEMFGYEKPEVI